MQEISNGVTGRPLTVSRFDLISNDLLWLLLKFEMLIFVWDSFGLAMHVAIKIEVKFPWWNRP